MKPLGYLLNDAARLMKREFERQAKAYNLTLPQWKVVSTLAERDGMSQTALSTLIEVSPMTLSDMLERLEGNGLLTRDADPADSRAKLVRITPAARALVGEMRALAVGVYDRILAGVSEADRAALVRALTRITENLNDPVPETGTAEQETGA
jgi:DNA-binding MarR family transcriptional regulator